MRKKELVIVGVDDGELVVCMTEAFAADYTQLQKALSRATTWAEFRAIAPPDAVSEIESTLRESGDPRPRGSKRFEPDSIPGYLEGDWPAWPHQVMLSWVPQTVTSLGHQTSTLNGEYLHIESGRVDDVIAELRTAGFRVKRRDKAVRGE